MISTILSLILFLTFLILSIFHFYWLFGGIWGVKKVIPTQKSKPNSIKIPKIATLIVALVLLTFSLLYFIKSALITITLSNLLLNYAYWIIPSLFILRAIGDFNYVGFFKKIKGTEFAQADTKIFVPLCIFIGLSGIIINLLS